jgi:hypothetical protein
MSAPGLLRVHRRRGDCQDNGGKVKKDVPFHIVVGLLPVKVRVNYFTAALYVKPAPLATIIWPRKI